jgi:hypothetical protein
LEVLFQLINLVVGQLARKIVPTEVVNFVLSSIGVVVLYKSCTTEDRHPPSNRPGFMADVLTDI